MLAPHLAARAFPSRWSRRPRACARRSTARGTPRTFERRLNEFKDRRSILRPGHILTTRRTADAPRSREALHLNRVVRIGLPSPEPPPDRARPRPVVDAPPSCIPHPWRSATGSRGPSAALPVRYAILGLGKNGRGCARYASDIECLVVYKRQRLHVRPREDREQGVFDMMVRELLAPWCTASAKGSSTSTCGCAPTGGGSAGMQPGKLLHVLRARRTRALLRKARPRAAARRGRRPALSAARSNACATRWSTRRRASTSPRCARCARGRSRKRRNRAASMPSSAPARWSISSTPCRSCR